uniref:Secreted protein n=1 Tax=Globodera pallida TaxID=36090 RepID=A0A183BT22_GLOPA
MAPPTVLCLRMMAKALYLLVGGNEASIVLRQDWAHLLKLWLALSELVTGIVCGSKLWRHTKVRKVQKLLEKLLPDTFLELTLEVAKN